MASVVLIQTAAPSGLIVTVAEAKAHMNVDHGEKDDLITSFLNAAQQHVDGWTGVLGRALLTQSWEMRLDAFPCDIRIPLPPLVTIDSVKYIDADGTLQTVSSIVYQVISGGEWHARLQPAYGQVWPSPRCEPGCVRIVFTAGYGLAAAVPERIKNAIRQLVAHWWENREATGKDELYKIPAGFDDQLTPLRASFF